MKQTYEWKCRRANTVVNMMDNLRKIDGWILFFPQTSPNFRVARNNDEPSNWWGPEVGSEALGKMRQGGGWSSRKPQLTLAGAGKERRDARYLSQGPHEIKYCRSDDWKAMCVTCVSICWLVSWQKDRTSACINRSYSVNIESNFEQLLKGMKNSGFLVSYLAHRP